MSIADCAWIIFWIWIVFWIVALIASGLYGWNAWIIFVSPSPPSWVQQQWHQRWLNFLGALVGWTALWLLLRKFGTCVVDPALRKFAPCVVGQCINDVGALDVVGALVAFVGVTGHLPYVVIGLVSGIPVLARKLVEVLATLVAATLGK
jgi:hypothetical protein